MAFYKSEMKLIKQTFIKFYYQSDISRRYIFQSHAIYFRFFHRLMFASFLIISYFYMICWAYITEILARFKICFIKL